MNRQDLDDHPAPGEERSASPMAGGVFIALGTLVGAVVGGLMGQPSAGLVTGLALGVAAALIIWWRDRHNG